MEKPRRYKPSVTFTIKLSWTTTQAKRFHRDYMKTAGFHRNDGTGCWFPYSDFEEGLLDETNFGDFLTTPEAQHNIWGSDPAPYFNFVIDSL